MPRFLLLLLLSASLSAGAQTTLTLHVAPGGDDSWTGRQPQASAASDGPLRTLPAAQRAARAALAARPGGGIRVLIQPGVYVLDEPLVFGPADSGSAGQPVVYQASEPGKVILSGGRPLAAQPSPAPRGEANFVAPAVDAGFWAGGPQLYVNGRRAVLARQPKLGSYWYAGQAVPVPGEPPTALGQEAFHAAPAALAFVQRLSADDRARALVHVMQSWSSGRHRLAVGAPNEALRLSPRARWPFLFFGTSQRYYLENVAAALDQPGEWIGGPSGVRYLLRPDDTGPASAVLPMLDQLVVVRGAGPAGPFVQHLELRDLAFAHSRALTPAAGWVDTQAAVDIGAAILVDFARDVVLRGCQISATGGYGVWLRDGVRGSTVTGCTMNDLGAGAVKVGNPATTAAAANDASATGGNTVSGNRIRQTGQQYPGAVAVWVGPSFDNLISHNTITDTTYTAISVGWQWGYGSASSGRNRIVGNALLDIGGGELADLGGIYTLGISPGTVIADNLIREVRGYREHGAGAWGIYNDEGSSDLRVENNVVVGTDSGGYHLHFGRNVQLLHNLFAQGDAAEITVSRSDPERTRLAVRDNLLITSSASPLAEFAKPPDAEFSGNLVAPLRAGPPPELQACGAGCSASSAALGGGTGRQQIKLAGISTDAAKRWVDAAANAGAGGEMPAAMAKASSGALRLAASEAASANTVTSAATAAAGPPLLQLTMDLATMPEHQRPPAWRYAPATPREAIETVADASAPGKRCLQLNDSATFANRYEPYVYVALNHKLGTSTASFALRIDDTADILHEWRDNAKPYRTGPSLRISRAGVEAGGRVVAPARPGTWLQIKVTAGVADGGPWTLQVTDADGKVSTANGLPPKTPGWRGLRWLGFIANATVDSAACLAAVKVTNDSAP